MLLMRMSSRPKITVGRTIAYPRPESRIICSTLALPRKYANGESSAGLVMLTWTIRGTPASCDSRIKVSLVATRGCPTQTLRELSSVVEIEGGDGDAIPERVRAIRMAGQRHHAPPGVQQACGDVPARVPEGPRHHVNLGHRDTLWPYRVEPH